MKTDITRSTFDPRKHYVSVRQQQGRVPLDADSNEHADITTHLRETATSDTLGHCAVPRHADGFRLVAAAADLTPTELARPGNATPPPLPALQGASDFYITSGRAYVDGILCENERILPFAAQPDFPGAALPVVANAPQEGTYLAYLDVWRRSITALEDPAIREVALGGPDTATRQKTVWQVKLFRLGAAALTPDQANCLTASPEWEAAIAAGTGRLAARAEPGAQSSDPCIVAPGAGYRRLENQLYRVEVHTAGALGTATFKWSRDNGSIVSRWESQDGASGERLTLSSVGRDRVLNFASGQWVELLDDTAELQGRPGTLVRITKVEGTVITVDPATATGPLLIAGFPRNPKVRRWDHAQLISPTNSTTFHDLESGVQVRFQAGTFRTGDYWMIPARTIIGDVEWPRDTLNVPLALAPQGIAHDQCRLAVMRFNGTQWTSISDCRCLFSSLAEPRLEYVGGDGQDVMPDLTLPTELVRLPEPIAVYAENLQCGESLLSLRFTVEPATDRLTLLGGAVLQSNAAGVLIVPAARADGIVQCEWRLNPAVQPPEPPPIVPPPVPRRRVVVELIDGGVVVQEPHPLIFTADLSIASKVAYLPGACVSLAGQKTVQAAIARLAALSKIEIAGGDGQDGAPGQRLPKRIEALVTSKCGPVEGATVRFVAESLGKIEDLNGVTGNPLEVKTGPDGLALCFWTPDPNPVLATQQLAAGLVALPTGGAELIEKPGVIRFTANLRTVSDDPAPVRVIRTTLIAANAPLANDQRLPLDQVLQGLSIFCDGLLDPSTVVDPASTTPSLIRRGQPTCFVTIEAPLQIFRFPFAGQTGEPQAYLPMVLHAAVGVTRWEETSTGGGVRSGSKIDWRPTPATQQLLASIRSNSREFGVLVDALLMRLTLKGNYIWSEKAEELIKNGILGGFLDGEAFRLPGAPGYATPTGDGRRGGDFEMWFWLVLGNQTPTGPIPKTPDVIKITDVVKIQETIKVTDVVKPTEAIKITDNLKAREGPKTGDVIIPQSSRTTGLSAAEKSSATDSKEAEKAKEAKSAAAPKKKPFIRAKERPSTTPRSTKKKPEGG